MGVIRLSKMGSEKETIFTLYMAKHLDILEKGLNLNLSEVVLEQSFDITSKEDVQKKKVLMLDMYGIEQELKVEVIIENVLTKSDDSHQRRLLKIIERLEKGIIIYQALGFRPKDVKQLKNAIKGKDINLYFVQINEDMIPLINKLNSEMHKLRIYENLNVLKTVVKPISLLKDISVIKPIQGNVTLMKEEVERDFSKPHVEANNYLLDQLQTNIPYFFPFQRRKNLENRYLSFGFGKSGVNLLISIEDMRHRAYVKLTFREFSPEIYYKIKNREEQARQLIGQELQFWDNKHTIEFRFKPYRDVRDTVDRLVDIAEKFILTFSNQVLYGEDRFGMQEDLQYSLN